MDEIKQRYSRRSRQNSSSATRAPVKRTPSQVSSDSRRSAAKDGVPKAPNLRRKRPSPQNRGDKTTMCTRDEDINIEEFMREDMNQLNKEEETLQREIKQMHLKNIGKHAQFVRKHKIDNQVANTEEMVRRMVSNERPQKSSQQQRPQLHQMQSAVNK